MREEVAVLTVAAIVPRMSGTAPVPNLPKKGRYSRRRDEAFQLAGDESLPDGFLKIADASLFVRVRRGEPLLNLAYERADRRHSQFLIRIRSAQRDLTARPIAALQLIELPV